MTEACTVVRQMSRTKEAAPFLKWAGGKAQLLEQYASLFPPAGSYNRYHEPFLGGGAVFYYLQPKLATLNDLETDLIATYKVVKNDVLSLIRYLTRYRAKHSEDFYYQVRDKYNSNQLDRTERAAAFIYLNKAGFNGLHRVNSKGEFNVPFGRNPNPAIFSEKNLVAVSKLLRGKKLTSKPFERVLDDAKPGDFIYFDPPYYPLNETSNFTSYTEGDFWRGEQKMLAAVAEILHQRRCFVMISNSATRFIEEECYGNPDIFNIERVSARRSINSVGSGRGVIDEVVIRNYV